MVLLARGMEFFSSSLLPEEGERQINITTRARNHAVTEWNLKFNLGVFTSNTRLGIDSSEELTFHDYYNLLCILTVS